MSDLDILYIIWDRRSVLELAVSFIIMVLSVILLSVAICNLVFLVDNIGIWSELEIFQNPVCCQVTPTHDQNVQSPVCCQVTPTHDQNFQSPVYCQVICTQDQNFQTLQPAGL